MRIKRPSSPSYSVIKPDNTEASCELISCVSSAGRRDVACLDLRLLNMSAGALSGASRLRPHLSPSKTVCSG